jgi:hypothetical protein
VFTRDATSWNTHVHINHHTGWEVTSGNDQAFQFGSDCANQNNQLADGGFFTRFHTRWRQSPYYDFTYGTVSFADPHEEDISVGCHAVDENGSSGSGFDKGRATIYQAFVGTHHTYGGTADWGNTDPMQQCDGSWASSNGNVGFWQILA